MNESFFVAKKVKQTCNHRCHSLLSFDTMYCPLPSALGSFDGIYSFIHSAKYFPPANDSLHSISLTFLWRLAHKSVAEIFIICIISNFYWIFIDKLSKRNIRRQEIITHRLHRHNICLPPHPSSVSLAKQTNEKYANRTEVVAVSQPEWPKVFEFAQTAPKHSHRRIYIRNATHLNNTTFRALKNSEKQTTQTDHNGQCVREEQTRDEMEQN